MVSQHLPSPLAVETGNQHGNDFVLDSAVGKDSLIAVLWHCFSFFGFTRAVARISSQRTFNLDFIYMLRLFARGNPFM